MPTEEKFLTEIKGPNGKNYPVMANHRVNFGKISGSLELPYLVAVQTQSFDWFKRIGIDEVFREIFPIQNNAKTITLEYQDCHFEEPEYKPLECKEEDLTYSSKLKATLLICNAETGEKKSAEVYMGDVPMMTASGTFIINGTEKVVVSQIIRSAGAYYENLNEKGTGYHAELIPTRGTWIEFENSLKGMVYVDIDHSQNASHKMPATVLFKALGFSEKNILDVFGDSDEIKSTIAKDKDCKTSNDALIEIFKKLKPGEPVTKEGTITFLFQRFFDEKRYDLGSAGRFKINQKLGIYNRLTGRVLGEPLIDANGEIAANENGEPFIEGYTLTKEDVEHLRDIEFFEHGAMEQDLGSFINPAFAIGSTKVNVVKVHAFDKISEPIVKVVGTDLNLSGVQEGTHPLLCLAVPDIVACYSYFENVQVGIGSLDDIDNLGNRRVRCVGELLQNQFRIGLTKMSKNIVQRMNTTIDFSEVKPQSLVSTHPLVTSIHEFFNTSQLSQLMDQVNPLSELANKRRLSALGPGGLSRERTTMAVRDVHYTHYGRICPIETPEGQNVGLINNLSSYARINKLGFIETPYRRVYQVKDPDGAVHVYISDEAVYLSADDERGLYIAEANIRVSDVQNIKVDGEVKPLKEILDKEVVTRHDDDNIMVPKELVSYVDVSPKQIVSVAAACIPFLEHDDSTRALMGANMQRQALPLLQPELPYVATGMEGAVAKDSGLAVVARADGVVKECDSREITVHEAEGDHTYYLQKFERSNQGTCINQTPIVHEGETIKKGQVIADGPSMKNGELALGHNLLIAYMTWNGYNYEDAVIMSERMVKDDTYTSIHIEVYDVECREIKGGDREEITRDIPNVGEEAKKYLDDSGVIIPGAEVKEGDILVGKTTPKGRVDPTPEEKLLMAIFAEKANEAKDTSLRVPHGGQGIVLKVKRFSRRNKDPLAPGVLEKIRVYIIQKRKISEGDKMSGRHGNKGVISKILPVEDMPFLPDGTPVDMLLSPMGVPSRMNIGQVFEVQLGLACRKLNLRVATPVFDGLTNDEIVSLMKKANLSDDGKTILYDGQTGERYPERIAVGVQYMIKLNHMVDDKLHARSVGPYSLITLQPLGGKAQNGGQRFGEMEVWALEAYGAAHTLQEMMTIKSDDRVGRRKVYEAIIKGTSFPKAGMPEAFKVFTKELKGLCMDVHLFDHDNGEINMDNLAKEALIDERKANSAIRNIASNNGNVDEDEVPEEEQERSVQELQEAAAEEGLSTDASLDDRDE